MSLIHSFQFTPAEGWVRAKNARRIEDLEEVTFLQKKVLALEKENESLRTIGSAELGSLAQGQDEVTWKVILNPRYKSGKTIQPHVSEFVIKSTWDMLFVACFAYSLPRAELGEVKRGLENLAGQKIAEEYPGDWSVQLYSEPIASDSMFEMVNRIRIQLLGLGYIEIEETSEEQANLFATSPQVYPMLKIPPIKHEHWKLTEKGALRCALIAGAKRRLNSIGTK
jgi:hypothetical protein